LSTLYGKSRARLAGKNYGNHVVFQVSLNFLLSLSYFVKPSRAPIKQLITKLLTRFCLILTICFSEIRQQIWITRELLNQTALKTILLKKQINITHAVLDFCTGRLVTSAPWESTLGNNLNKGMYPFIQIIPQGGLPRGRCDKSSRAEFQNSMCDVLKEEMLNQS